MKTKKWLLPPLLAIMSLLVAMSCSGCQAAPPQAYVTKVGNKYLLNVMPCNSESFTSVQVNNSTEPSDYQSEINNYWEANLVGDFPLNTLTLFGENPGYEATSSAKSDIAEKQSTVLFGMTKYGFPGSVTGVLSRIGPDEAMTSRGIVPISDIAGWWCN